jgi:flagellar biosynthesis protein FlhF
MKVKTFHALTMQDALRAIKQELGPDAIILSSKEVREGDRLLRLGNRPVLEVLAACEDPAPPPAPHREESQEAVARPLSGVPAAPALSGHNFHALLQTALEPAAEPAHTAVVSPPAIVTNPGHVEWRRKRLRHLRAELSDVSRLLGEGLPPETQSLGARVPPVLARLCRSLIRQGMHPSSAEALGNDLRHRFGDDPSIDEETLILTVRQEISRRIRVGGDLLSDTGGRTVGLILGPSGAGKTSMLTKLAAHYRLDRHRSVAVVTFDAYREMSVEHLRRYARALGVPFASARSPRQLSEGLRRRMRTDLVLIDMPGVGPNDVSSAQELHQYLGDELDVATHVVLPASAREGDLRNIIERVKPLPSLRILFTKLDETESFGTMFNVAYQTGVPLSYWGVGQRVPEDIERASPDRLAEFLMAQRYVMSRDRDRQDSALPEPVHAPEPVGSISESNEW